MTRYFIPAPLVTAVAVSSDAWRAPSPGYLTLADDEADALHFLRGLRGDYLWATAEILPRLVTTVTTGQSDPISWPVMLKMAGEAPRILSLGEFLAANEHLGIAPCLEMITTLSAANTARGGGGAEPTWTLTRAANCP